MFSWVDVYLFLPERMKFEKVEKFVVNLEDKIEYVIYITHLKQTSNHKSTLKKFIEWFNLSDWLKLNLVLNTDQRKKAKNGFEKYCFKLMNNAVFEKNYEKCEKT